MKDSGTDIESEKKQRNVQKEIRCGKVRSEKRLLSNSNSDMIETPVAYIENIPDFVKSVLDQYEENRKLTWHNGAIPSNEIWVKVGGDHGGWSFKTMPHANSRKNTFLLSIVNCKDTPQNLRKILNPYKKQIEDLQKNGMEWKKG